MLIDRYGDNLKNGIVNLASGDFANGWNYVTVNLSDDIVNFRELIIAFLRKDGNWGYIHVPVINGTIGSRFNTSETANNVFRYITVNIQSYTDRSITLAIHSWLNSSNNEPRTIKAVYGMQ